MGYGQGENYDSKFTTIGSSYEKCRAECVGIHLCLEPGVTGEDFKYINWLAMILAGVKGFETFSPASKEWKQTHRQTKFVIMQVMLEAGEHQGHLHC